MGTIVAAWPAELVRYLEGQGLDRGKLLAKAKIAPAELSDDDGRVTEAQLANLWAQGEQLGDPNLGLHFATTLRSARAFGMIGYLARATATLQEVLESLDKFHALLGFASTRLDRHELGTTLTLQFHPRIQGTRHATEAAIAALVIGCRASTGTNLAPRTIRFEHAAPPTKAEHERIFGCPVGFGAKAYAIEFAAASLALPLLSRDRQLKTYLESAAEKKLETQVPVGLAGEVAFAIERGLPGSVGSLDEVAKAMAMSARTLQRRLSDEGRTFAEVVDDVRRRLALGWLDDGKLTKSEIAYRLGFQDPSALRRALKRWEAAPTRSG